jgi:hypothetical protein
MMWHSKKKIDTVADRTVAICQGDCKSIMLGVMKEFRRDAIRSADPTSATYRLCTATASSNGSITIPSPSHLPSKEPSSRCYCDLPLRCYRACRNHVGSMRHPLQTSFIRVAGCLGLLGADAACLGVLNTCSMRQLALRMPFSAECAIEAHIKVNCDHIGNKCSRLVFLHDARDSSPS